MKAVHYGPEESNEGPGSRGCCEVSLCHHAEWQASRRAGSGMSTTAFRDTLAMLKLWRKASRAGKNQAGPLDGRGAPAREGRAREGREEVTADGTPLSGRRSPRVTSSVWLRTSWTRRPSRRAHPGAHHLARRIPRDHARAGPHATRVARRWGSNMARSPRTAVENHLKSRRKRSVEIHACSMGDEAWEDILMERLLQA